MSSPRPRRWLQFRLSTLLIVVTLATLPVGYVAWEREQCRLGEAALNVLDQHVPTFQNPRGSNNANASFPRPSSQRPSWLKGILGDDRFRLVNSASLHGDVSSADLRHIAALPNLHELNIEASNVTFQGVEHLGRLKLVEKFSFYESPSYRRYGGENYPRENWDFLSQWHHLRSLSLQGNNFGEDGIPKLPVLASLKDLRLDSSNISDAGLERIALLTNLETLSLQYASVSDDGLRHLSRLSELQELDLADTKVVGSGLAHLAALTKLESLNLCDSKVTDDGLASLAGLTKLNRLRLDRTAVTDAGLAHLSGLKNLETLYLDSTKVSDDGLVHLRPLTNLKNVFLSDTKVTRPGVIKMQRSMPKTSFHLVWRDHGHGE